MFIKIRRKMKDGIIYNYAFRPTEFVIADEYLMDFFKQENKRRGTLAEKAKRGTKTLYMTWGDLKEYFTKVESLNKESEFLDLIKRICKGSEYDKLDYFYISNAVLNYIDTNYIEDISEIQNSVVRDIILDETVITDESLEKNLKLFTRTFFTSHINHASEVLTSNNELTTLIHEVLKFSKVNFDRRKRPEEISEPPTKKKKRFNNSKKKVHTDPFHAYLSSKGMNGLL